MTLWEINEGQQVKITGIILLNNTLRIRLHDLGFRLNATVTCDTVPTLGAPRLYRICSTTFALEREVAEAFVVEVL